MKSESISLLVAKILFLIFVGVFSFFILATKAQDMRMFEYSVESLNEKNSTVLKFAGSCIAASVAISALPDDFASPIANELAELNQYFVLLLIVIFLERLLVVEGVGIVFKVFIPVCCFLYILNIFVKKSTIKNLANKMVILSIAIIFVIPFSSWFSDSIGANYLSYVEDTIEETDSGAGKINGIMNNNDEADEQTIFEKLSGAFKTAIQSVSDFLDYFNNVLKRCINSIAIMIVTTFIVPVLVLMFFVWLLRQLFDLKITAADIKTAVIKNKTVDVEDSNV